ncbi:ubiquitin carboxyl-terminal hydrolase 16 isoform X2 [Dendrobates tinctorius]|uniref:ubiquitin carboxyl-terminal hydrolase 16 isoform X2 n=1 Tax=Dendrobates tinctorius TaxID=92724 RepID=UPI003CC9571E
MAKKKGKNLPVQESAETGPTCKHIRKGVDEGVVKRALVNVEWNVCQDCHTDSKEKASSEEEEDVVWICLKCGHRGCGRYSEQTHALNHYNTPRSEPHCLVLSVGDWNVWCYLCDSEVDHNCSGRLRQLVEYIQKKSKSNVRAGDKGETDEVISHSDNIEEKETPQTGENSTKSTTKVEKTVVAEAESKEITVKGLSNLGNTCFFNAVLQNVSQTPALRELLNELKLPGRTVTVQVPDTKPAYQVTLEQQQGPREVTLEQQLGPREVTLEQQLGPREVTLEQQLGPREVTLEQQLGPREVTLEQQLEPREVTLEQQLGPREVTLEQQPGPLTLAMWQFLTEMETKKGVVTPKELLSQVCKKAVRFRGYQQQDSHELLRYLLDGMRGEEIQRVSAALSKALTEDSENLDEEEVKKLIKECEKRRVIPNFVDRLFGGELTSTIMCETCGTVTLVHEPFLDLSLPGLDDTPKNNNLKTSKNVREQRNEDDDDNNGYVKDRNDSASGTSKHFQKKAKKQAKKQAKNHRRQQKLQGKTLLFTDLNAGQEEEEDEGVLSDNNARDNNAGSRVEPSAADVSLSVTEEAGMERSEDPSVGNNKTSRNNVGLEILSDGAENYIETSSGNTEDNCDSGSKTTEVQVNGDVNQVNMDDREALYDVTQRPQVEEDTNQLTESINRLNLSSSLEPGDVNIEIIDDGLSKQVYEVVNEDPKTAFCTLSDRKKLQLEDLSILACLDRFTRKESLVGSNQLLCNTCTRRQAKTVKNNTKGEKKFVYTNAKKQMLVSVPPPILTLHLKRFQQNSFNLHKLNKHIKFPEVIDLAPFCNAKCKTNCDGDDRLLYALYGVIEHSGTMRSGHYTAYVKSRTLNPNLSELVIRGSLPEESNTEPSNGHWYHISDSHVQAVPLSKVLNSQAYLLFYERIL